MTPAPGGALPRGPRAHTRRAGRRIAVVTIAALLVGILLLALPRFRREAILQSNRDFFPHLDTTAAGGPRP
jgi:hypothetical protein